MAEFADPRLVAIYDAVNAYDADAQPGFYSHLASEIGAHQIVDLGCGTGLITRELAHLGYVLTGVDPAPAMLDRARRAPFGDHVEWICGDAELLGARDADLAIMSGHVAQFFLTDESWRATLVALHASLRPGGRLAFESRNPGAREWELWAPARRVSVDDPEAGRIETWSETHDVREGIVSYTNHYVFTATDQEVVSTGRLRFRTEAALAQSLAETGFTIERLYGDWDRRPAGPTTRELIVVAVARSAGAEPPVP